MSRKMFGTDGVRGQANTWPMTAEVALRLGAAVGRYFRRGPRTHRVVIGKDTRRSGYMIETALTAGLTSVGMDVFLLGPVPTPAVGMLTRSMRADLGIMISASHNPFQDNGIKLFGPDGYKMSDAAEAEIEAMLEGDVRLAQPINIGRARRIEGDRTRYMEFVKTTVPRGLRLEGLKIVVDCANGAAYRTAPEVLWELGADVVSIGVEPNGLNINEGCGSTAPQAAAARVREVGADLGICLDGDADRVILIDEKGQCSDGDQMLARIAGLWADQGLLAGGTVVATIMSNLGLEQYLAGRGLSLHRTAVGDRYVVEAMRAGGYNLGGEQSGHVVMSDFVTTGDGLIAALQFLVAMRESGRPASELSRAFEPVPQLLKNTRTAPGANPLADAAVQAAIASGTARLGSTGRLVIRPSGTEPLIRVMGESTDAALLTQVVDEISDVIARAG